MIAIVATFLAFDYLLLHFYPYLSWVIYLVEWYLIIIELLSLLGMKLLVLITFYNDAFLGDFC